MTVDKATGCQTAAVPQRIAGHTGGRFSKVNFPGILRSAAERLYLGSLGLQPEMTA